MYSDYIFNMCICVYSVCREMCVEDNDKPETSSKSHGVSYYYYLMCLCISVTIFDFNSNFVICNVGK